ncbi:DinB family protein [Echinicola strongylocentroti]|uniref:DinB family protein n=1 Tax=Echinicola strongylocentroti TaxID=1795355 RepID=A0A2Z4IJZ4_9BACT|nr:DinB family protein [Echinicola strongylocentroti]AWW31019.1 DinB family protein [Echinicola strongylocentroti]
MNTNKDVFAALKEISQQLITMLSSLSEKQLNTVPFEGSWTAGQVGNHLLKSYAAADILGGETSECHRKPDEKVWEVKNLFLDFTIKMDSPAEIVPDDGPIDKAALIPAIEKRLGQFMAFQESDVTRICGDFAIPEYGDFTRLEWLWFTVFHTRRHVYQLEKIKAKLTKSSFINVH